jgi:hypothetical protein
MRSVCTCATLVGYRAAVGSATDHRHQDPCDPTTDNRTTGNGTVLKKFVTLAAAGFAAAAIAGCAADAPVAAAPPTAPARTAPASPAPADTAQPCNQLLNPDPHRAFICITQNAFTGPYGADYWMDEAYQRDMAFHPAKGLLAASEIFFCRPNGIITDGYEGSIDEGSTATESWCARGAPGIKLGAAEWQARLIVLADGCVVYHWDVIDSQTNPAPPTTCLNQFTGKFTKMTALEQKSTIDFWHSMADEPGPW